MPTEKSESAEKTQSLEQFKTLPTLLDGIFLWKLSSDDFSKVLYENAELKERLVSIIMSQQDLLWRFFLKEKFLDKVMEEIIMKQPDFFLVRMQMFDWWEEYKRSLLMISLYYLERYFQKNKNQLDNVKPEVFDKLLDNAILIVRNISRFDYSVGWAWSVNDALFRALSYSFTPKHANKEKILSFFSLLDSDQYNTLMDYTKSWEMKIIFDTEFPKILDKPGIDKKKVLISHFYAYKNIVALAPYLDESYLEPDTYKHSFPYIIARNAPSIYTRYEDFERDINILQNISEKTKQFVKALALEYFSQSLKEIALPWQIPYDNTNHEWWEGIAMKIKKEWIILNWKDTLSDREKSRYIVYISRNFIFEWKDEKDITEETVKQMISKITETRDLYGNMPLFTWRNVIFAANWDREKNKVTGDLSILFWQIKTQIQIEKQSWNYTFIQPNNTIDSAKREKERLMDKILDTPPPFTLIFDGHGDTELIYLSGWEIVNNQINLENTVWISFTELAELYKERLKRWSHAYSDEDMWKRDIFVFWTCYSANFSKNFLRQLGESKKPIIIWESEYNQLWKIYNNGFGGNFLGNILNLRSWASVTISTVINWAIQQTSDPRFNSNSYIFFPSSNSSLQISKLEKEYALYT